MRKKKKYCEELIMIIFMFEKRDLTVYAFKEGVMPSWSIFSTGA
jgi:hypothetical protein